MEYLNTKSFFSLIDLGFLLAIYSELIICLFPSLFSLANFTTLYKLQLKLTSHLKFVDLFFSSSIFQGTSTPLGLKQLAKDGVSEIWMREEMEHGMRHAEEYESKDP